MHKGIRMPCSYIHRMLITLWNKTSRTCLYVCIDHWLKIILIFEYTEVIGCNLPYFFVIIISQPKQPWCKKVAAKDQKSISQELKTRP